MAQGPLRTLPDLVHFTGERALELGTTEYERSPATGDMPEIARVLREHLDDTDVC